MHSTTSTSFTNPSPVEDQYTISVGKFVFLCFITAGLYQLWWSYKAWRFFKQKQDLAITPALRALFGLFFFGLYSVELKIFQKKKGIIPDSILFYYLLDHCFLNYFLLYLSLILFYHS